MIDPARAQADRLEPYYCRKCGHYGAYHRGGDRPCYFGDGVCNCDGFELAASRPARSPQEPPQLDLGTLLDLLDEAACLIDEGRVAPTETLKCIYRDAMYSAIEQLRAAALPVPPAPQPLDPEMVAKAVCLDCGLPYADFPLDVILPRPQWLEIHPDESGLLCASCIVKRAAKVPGVTCVHAILEIAPARAAAAPAFPPTNICKAHGIDWCEVCMTDEAFLAQRTRRKK